MLTSGSPNASVLCDAQKEAAVTSSFGNFSTLKKTLNAYRLNECKADSMIKSISPCERSIPRPFVKALQNAFQTIPIKIYYFVGRKVNVNYNSFDKSILGSILPLADF